MNKFLFTIILLLSLIFTTRLEAKDISLGIQAGLPSGLSLGIGSPYENELNIILGVIPPLQGEGLYVVGGVNYLFSLVDFKKVEGKMGLQLGPEIHLGYNTDGNNLFVNDFFAVLKFQHTFKSSPINLFVKIGGGLSVFYENPIRLAGGITVGLGVRYVFLDNKKK